MNVTTCTSRKILLLWALDFTSCPNITKRKCCIRSIGTKSVFFVHLFLKIFFYYFWWHKLYSYFIISCYQNISVYFYVCIDTYVNYLFTFIYSFYSLFPNSFLLSMFIAYALIYVKYVFLFYFSIILCRYTIKVM